MKVGVVGMGWVGSSVAISILQSGIASEVLVSDANRELAAGEAMDLAHGASFYPPAHVRAVEPSELESADAVVISAGRGGTAKESRLDLLKDNASIVGAIAASLKRLRGLLVIVTNPVDVMTYVAQKASGLPAARVIGTGTMLDTARLRQVLGRELALEPRSVHAQVVGEHGDSEVVLWSGAHAGGVPLDRFPNWHKKREAELALEVRRAAFEIIRRKGATNHAIGLVTAALLKTALRDERRILTVSRVQEGALGLQDVALSLPTTVGLDGATQVLEPEMSEAERDALHRSAEILRAARFDARLGPTPAKAAGNED
jgi:L-lactate dehydrogenase